MSDYVIRPFETQEDYQACVALQEETWGEGFSERVSTAILKVSQILGGVASGAFTADGRLDGFVFGMTGVRGDRLVHWSDMLAVRTGLRDSGLGARLKAHQRAVLLDRGIGVMHWTFDPLQSRNAHLNFVKLGILVREYVEDMYGASDSPLHRGIGTDRFIAFWPMASERVYARLDGEAPDLAAWADAPWALDAEEPAAGALPRPGTPTPGLEAEAVRVAIPADIGAVMEGDLSLAVAWREATRAVLPHYLARGYQVEEFARGPAVSHYILVHQP